MAIRFETLRPTDQPARHELGGLAFGGSQPMVDEHVIPHEHVSAAYDGDELVASATLLPGGHWFGGRAVTGPGIGGVSVAPHRRGEGIAKPLMQDVVRRAHDGGAAVSGLYPTTASLYRSLGWEIAGEYVQRRFRVDTLVDERPPDLVVEPFDVADLGTSTDAVAYDGLAARSQGHVVRGDFWWWRRRCVLAEQKARIYALRVRTRNGSGFLVLTAVETSDAVFDLLLVDAGATDAATLRALGSVLARFGTVSDTITTHLPPWIVQAWTSKPQAAIPGDGWGWMLRVINAPLAVEQRGWNAIDGSVDLLLHDDTVEENTGPWRLSLTDGRGRLEPGGSGTWLMDIRAFASWYSGWTSASQLIMTGRLAPVDDREDLAMLDAATAGPTTCVPEFY